MISLTIDASVFALKQEDSDPEEEYKNIQRFITNLFYLQYLEDCPSVTVSYLTLKYLPLDFLDPVNLLPRIKKVRGKLKYYSHELLDFYHDKFSEIVKCSTGIYKNIYPEIKDIHITFDESNYPFTGNKKIFIRFKRFLGFLAELNSKYFSDDVNYIIIGKNSLQKQGNTALFYDKRPCKVNIAGLREIYEIQKKAGCEIYEIQDIKTEIINKPDGNLSLGQAVSFDEIGQKVSSQPFIQTKLYFYLKALDSIAGILQDKNINFNEEEIKYMVNAHGCLCSPDNDIYGICEYKYRHFENKKGHPEYFSLHLKPVTEYKNDNDNNSTVRVYFKTEEQKFLIGWIGIHPKTCYKCEKQPECEIKVNEGNP